MKSNIIILFAFFFFISFNGMCQWRKNIPDTLTWEIDIRQVYFESYGKYFPFTMKIRNDAWFVRTISDIKIGFVDYEDQESTFELGFGKENRVVRVEGNPYSFSEKVDTIRSSFSSRIFKIDGFRESENTYLDDSEIAKLSRDLEYSFLIQKSDLGEMPQSMEQNKIRLIYPAKAELSFQRMNIIEIILSNENPTIYFSEVNSSNALDLSAVRLKNTELVPRHLGKIFSLIENIDLEEIQLLDNSYCIDSNSLKDEFLIEINWQGQHYYGVFCHTWRDIKIDKIDNLTMENLLKLKSELIRVMSKNQKKLIRSD